MHDFWNQWPGVILGAEGEPEPKTDPDPKEDLEDPDDPEDKGEGEGEGTTDKSKEDFEAVQKALDAERRITKRQERELKRLRITQETGKEEKQEDLERTRQESEAVKAQNQKLAAGLLTRDVDAAIREAAKDAKFIDPEDAVNGVDRSKIVAEQDDEDPTDIFVDETTVQAAVKALATKKSHFIRSGTDDGDATGSPFGGSKKKKQQDEEALRELYPSL